MPMAKDSAPNNRSTSTSSATGSGEPTTTSPTDPALSGPTGSEPNQVQEDQAQGKRTYHDSMTGAQVTESGEFVDESRKHQGPIPAHRVVADDWPNTDGDIK